MPSFSDHLESLRRETEEVTAADIHARIDAGADLILVDVRERD